MKIIVIGGDGRFPVLCRMLAEDGHSVFPLAMEEELPVQGPPDWAGAEAVILPLPAERFGVLNAPLSREKCSLKELLRFLPAGKRVFAGMAGAELKKFCRERGVLLSDYFEREEFQIKNALLTAEGALGLMLKEDGRSLSGKRVLICGFGRIGRLLAPRLNALGCRVTAAARSASDRAWAEAMGCAAANIKSWVGESFDFVVNTVPAQIFGKKELESFGNAKLIELASAPFGFDMKAAEALGKDVVKAPGLPALWSETSAAEAIRDTIYNMLEE